MTIKPEEVRELIADVGFIAAHDSDLRKEERLYEAATALDQLLREIERLREMLLKSATYVDGYSRDLKGPEYDKAKALYNRIYAALNQKGISQ